MSSLQRWSEEGATTDELSLLELSRCERPPTQARTRALEALGIGVVATSTTTSAVAAVGKGGASALLKLAALSVIGVGVAAGGVVLHSAHERGQETKATHSAALVPSVAASVETPVAVSTPAVSASGSTAPGTVGSAPRAAHSSAGAGTLSQEVTALELAHEALAAHKPGVALRQLEHYRTQFPGGVLASEATVLRVQAMLASGDRSGAQALADIYSTSHPDSPYARRIEALLQGGRQP